MNDTMLIAIDTSVLVGILYPNDHHHNHAKQLAQAINQANYIFPSRKYTKLYFGTEK
jgi:predicted nucleic acid-binding protein